MFISQPLLIPVRPLPGGFEVENCPKQAVPRRFPSLDPDAGRKAYHAKRAEWAKLNLRQTWADEEVMRNRLKAAGIKVANDIEPATVTRMRSLLRRAGMDAAEIVAAVGTSLGGFLDLNPSLPLWAAVALVLESAGHTLPPAPIHAIQS